MKRLHIHHKYLWLLIALAFATNGCDRRKQGEDGDLSPTVSGAPDTQSDKPSGTAQTSTVASASTIANTAPAATGKAALNPGDLSFLSTVTKANEEEIATTELGMSRGNEKNKELARMLNGDHVSLRDQVNALAPDVRATEDAKPPQQLVDLQGEAFDGQLLATLRQQHEQAITLFTQASTDRTLSEPVRQLASDTLPTLKNHLAAVQAALKAE